MGAPGSLDRVVSSAYRTMDAANIAGSTKSVVVPPLSGGAS
jgi:hypothetical protein